MTTLPVQMIDRWASRSEPGPGQGTVYWHMLMNDHPQVVSLATKAQQRLAPFTGLHMTPLERLHMTTMIAGPSHDFSDDQLHRMIEAAGDLLSRTPPIAVTLGQILYHPEAIMLAVTPAQALMPVRDAVQAATQLVTGKNPPTDTPRWTPHVTISYSTSAKPAGPIIAALGPQLPSCEIQVSAVSLVIQHGPERLWDWHTIGTVHLPAPART